MIRTHTVQDIVSTWYVAARKLCLIVDSQVKICIGFVRCPTTQIRSPISYIHIKKKFEKILVISKFKGMERSSLLSIFLFKIITKVPIPWFCGRAFLCLSCLEVQDLTTFDPDIFWGRTPRSPYQPILLLCKKNPIISNEVSPDLAMWNFKCVFIGQRWIKRETFTVNMTQRRCESLIMLTSYVSWLQWITWVVSQDLYWFCLNFLFVFFPCWLVGFQIFIWRKTENNITMALFWFW